MIQSSARLFFVVNLTMPDTRGGDIGDQDHDARPNEQEFLRGGTQLEHAHVAKRSELNPKGKMEHHSTAKKALQEENEEGGREKQKTNRRRRLDESLIVGAAVRHPILALAS